MAQPFYTGVTTAGISPALLEKIQQAVTAVGGIGVVITSGRRPPGPGNDVKNSNHITGDAIDGYAVMTDGSHVPIGQALVKVAPQYGLRSGDEPGFDPKTPGGYDPIHVDDGANVGGVKPYATTTSAPVAQTIAATTPAASTSAWPQSAQLAYRLAIQAGLNPTDAKDFASVQYGESGFDPTNYVGKSQGHSYVPYHTAGGLYQLLSKGYVDKANQLGGIFDPTANIKAILPNYVDYYKAHPSYVPGAAGATVEASGEPASYYAQGLQHLSGAAPVTAAIAATPTAAVGRQPAAAAPPTVAPPAPAQGLPSIVRKILGVPAGRSSPAPAAAPTALPPIVRRILRS